MARSVCKGRRPTQAIFASAPGDFTCRQVPPLPPLATPGCHRAAAARWQPGVARGGSGGTCLHVKSPGAEAKIACVGRRPLQTERAMRKRKKVVTTKEAGAILGVDAATIYRWAVAGKLPGWR